MSGFWRRSRETTAIHAHLDDTAMRDAAAQAAAVIARAMGYWAEPPPLSDVADDEDIPAVRPEFSKPSAAVAPGGLRTPLWLRSRDKNSDRTHGPEDHPRNPIMESVGGGPAETNSRPATEGNSQSRNPRGPLWY